MACIGFACISVLAQSPYSGPAILSRATGTTTGERGAARTGFTFYAGASGSFETGVAPAAVDAQGKIINIPNLWGTYINLGAYGRHTWRHTTLGLDYSGNFRHYPDYSSLDGSDQMLGVSVSHQLSRRVQMYERTAVGTFSQYYVNGPVTATDLLSQPAYSVLDNRASYLEQNAGVVYMFTSRLSVSGAGSGFTVRRQSNALVGLNGYSAQGTMAYRLTRTRTVDLSYAFIHYDYPRGFGETDLHNYSLGVSQALGRRWQISVSGGVAQAFTVGTEEVAADPITAALFGTQTTVRVFSRTLLFGTARGDLSGTFRRSRVSFYYSQSPSPGNGIYLTSKQTNTGFSYSYSGIRRASVSASANYNRLSSLGQSQIGRFNYFSAGVGGSYKILPSVEAMMRFDSRNLQVDQSGGFSRLSYRILIGLNWHPGEFPITLW